MTTLAQVTALVDAHVRRDHARFRAVTLQIAASVAARSALIADQLRKLVDSPQTLVLLPNASGLFSVPLELPTLDDMVLAPRIREQLDRVVLEHERRGLLEARGLRPTRKLLFTGPPGVGKSMAARALSQAVGLPMLRVELHGVISQHLGETASKLSKVFEHVDAVPAVYLFDEVDALSTERLSLGGDSAGAEMRRVVNTLLQLIEDDRSNSLIVAATNHEQMLDAAIFRRFDDAVAFTAPSQEEVGVLVQRALIGFVAPALDLDAIYRAVALAGLGHADVCATLDRVRKDHVIAGIPIATGQIVDGIVRRPRGNRGKLAA